MTDPVSRSSSRLRVRALIVAVWGMAAALAIGGLLAMPRLADWYFWNWHGSQREIIDRLASQGRWQGALARVDRMIESRPWDPRPLHRRAELLRDQLIGRRYDTAADADVAAAFEAACRAYFKMAQYPALLSPETRREMADAYFQWGVCASRQGDWDVLGFCMEYAADLDPVKVDEVLRQTIEGSTDLADVPIEVLRSVFHIMLRHRSSEEALEFLRECRDLIPRDEWLTLALRCIVARDHRKTRDEIIAAQAESLEWQLILQSGVLGRSMSSRIAYLPLYETLNAGRSARRTPIDWVQLGRFEEVLRTATIDAPEDFAATPTAEGWCFFSDQEVRFTWESEPPSAGTVCLMLSGTEAMDVWPVIEVEINRQGPTLHLLNGGMWTGLDLEVPGGRLESIAVRYHNDGGFRRLSPEGDFLMTLQDRNVQLYGAFIYTGTPTQ